MTNRFTHVDDKNNPSMVDVGDKSITTRSAHAVGYIYLPQEVLSKLVDGDIQSKKGPVFHTAIIAGTMAIKKTSDLIPFCHQLNIEGCKIIITPEDDKKRVRVDCKARTTGKTGIEMEVLTGASIATLTIYDMCKAFGQDMRIDGVQLIEKRGGKSDISRGPVC